MGAGCGESLGFFGTSFVYQRSCGIVVGERLAAISTTAIASFNCYLGDRYSSTIAAQSNKIIDFCAVISYAGKISLSFIAALLLLIFSNTRSVLCAGA